MAPKISVVIDNYNYGRFLEETLDSILAQEISAEIIVADDGSTDESRDILKAYAGRGVRALLQENQGQATATSPPSRHDMHAPPRDRPEHFQYRPIAGTKHDRWTYNTDRHRAGIRGRGLFTFAHIERSPHRQRCLDRSERRTQTSSRRFNPLAIPHLVDPAHFEQPHVF